MKLDFFVCFHHLCKDEIYLKVGIDSSDFYILFCNRNYNYEQCFEYV